MEKKTQSKEERKATENGRVIARAMREEQVQHQKNMIKAERRRQTMLENAAERALSGN